jgi:hypothetical protein
MRGLAPLASCQIFNLHRLCMVVPCCATCTKSNLLDGFSTTRRVIHSNHTFRRQVYIYNILIHFTTNFKSLQYDAICNRTYRLVFLKCKWILFFAVQHAFPVLVFDGAQCGCWCMSFSLWDSVSQAVPKVSEQQSTQDMRLWIFVTWDIHLWQWSQNFCKYCKADPIQSWKNPRTLTNFMIGWCFRCSKTWHLWGDVNGYGWHGMMLPNPRRLRSKSRRNHQPSSWTCPCSTCSNYIILHLQYIITAYYGIKSTWGLWINPGSRICYLQKARAEPGGSWWSLVDRLPD